MLILHEPNGDDGDHDSCSDESDGNRVQRPPAGTVICLLSRWLTRPYLLPTLYCITIQWTNVWNMPCLCCIVDHKQPADVQYVAMSTEPCQDSQCPKTAFSIIMLQKSIGYCPSKALLSTWWYFHMFESNDWWYKWCTFFVMMIVLESKMVFRSIITGHHWSRIVYCGSSFTHNNGTTSLTHN